MFDFEGEEVTLMSLNTRFEKLERLLLQRFPDTDNSEAEASATEGRVPNRRGNRRRRAREKRRQWTDDYASASEGPTEHPSDTADDYEGDEYHGMTREEEHHALNSHSLWEALGPIIRTVAEFDGLSDAQAEAEVRNMQAVVSKYKANRAGGGSGTERRASATGYLSPGVSVPPWKKDKGQPKAEAQTKPQAKAKANGKRNDTGPEAGQTPAKTRWADIFFPNEAGPAAGGPTPAQAASGQAERPGRGATGSGGRAATATATPKAATPFVESLWPDAWRATVLGPAKLDQSKANEQLVVVVRSEGQTT